MSRLGPITPVLRIFDAHKAKEFYVGFLGGAVVFEHRFGDNFPLYMGLDLFGCALHLSEHYADACPGAHVRIQTEELASFVAALRDKDYKFAKPGDPERRPWGALETALTDPFGNRLTFSQAVGADRP
jgi:uncharacterized glyoxalase superfamily protein PhnB